MRNFGGEGGGITAIPQHPQYRPQNPQVTLDGCGASVFFCLVFVKQKWGQWKTKTGGFLNKSRYQLLSRKQNK